MSVNMETTSDAPALDRGLSVLEYVIEASHPVTMKEISKAMSIPSASAFRLVKTLVQRGYLEEIDLSQQFYLPGNKIFQMVQFYQLNHSLQSVARSLLRDLAERTGQTAQLAILSGVSAMYIDQAIPKEPVSIVAPLHSFIPINVSAAGKILCCYLQRRGAESLPCPGQSAEEGEEHPFRSRFAGEGNHAVTQTGLCDRHRGIRPWHRLRRRGRVGQPQSLRRRNGGHRTRRLLPE